MDGSQLGNRCPRSTQSDNSLPITYPSCEVDIDDLKQFDNVVVYKKKTQQIRSITSKPKPLSLSVLEKSRAHAIWEGAKVRRALRSYPCQRLICQFEKTYDSLSKSSHLYGQCDTMTDYYINATREELQNVHTSFHTKFHLLTRGPYCLLKMCALEGPTLPLDQKIFSGITCKPLFNSLNSSSVLGVIDSNKLHADSIHNSNNIRYNSINSAKMSPPSPLRTIPFVKSIFPQNSSVKLLSPSRILPKDHRSDSRVHKELHVNDRRPVSAEDRTTVSNHTANTYNNNFNTVVKTVKPQNERRKHNLSKRSISSESERSSSSSSSSSSLLYSEEKMNRTIRSANAVNNHNNNNNIIYSNPATNKQQQQQHNHQQVPSYLPPNRETPTNSNLSWNNPDSPPSNNFPSQTPLANNFSINVLQYPSLPVSSPVSANFANDYLSPPPPSAANQSMSLLTSHSVLVPSSPTPPAAPPIQSANIVANPFDDIVIPAVAKRLEEQKRHEFDANKFPIMQSNDSKHVDANLPVMRKAISHKEDVKKERDSSRRLQASPRLRTSISNSQRENSNENTETSQQNSTSTFQRQVSNAASEDVARNAVIEDTSSSNFDETNSTNGSIKKPVNFLKRTSQPVSTQKLDWTGVRSKVFAGRRGSTASHSETTSTQSTVALITTSTTNNQAVTSANNSSSQNINKMNIIQSTNNLHGHALSSQPAVRSIPSLNPQSFVSPWSPSTVSINFSSTVQPPIVSVPCAEALKVLKHASRALGGDSSDAIVQELEGVLFSAIAASEAAIKDRIRFKSSTNEGSVVPRVSANSKWMHDVMRSAKQSGGSSRLMGLQNNLQREYESLCVDPENSILEE